MRVSIASTAEELESHQAAVCDVAHGLGLAIVGWRRGRVPPPELGGDGFHPWTWWETRSAFDHGKPVGVLMAGDLCVRRCAGRTPEPAP